MILTVIISIATILSLIIGILKYQEIRIFKICIQSYWLIVLIGAFLLIITNRIGITEIFKITKNEVVNPLVILILFISVTFISIVLDEVGFFSVLAVLAAKKAKKSQLKLFIILYALASILTIFTSNDIIILTFTPFICMLALRTKINPIPYLIANFIAANTWSTMLLIGNPTNIFLALTFDISFIEYFKVMFFPTIAAGIMSFIVVLLMFRKSLKKPLELMECEELTINTRAMVISLFHLLACTILLALSSFIHLEMWIICLGFAISLSTILLFINKKLLWRSLKRAPWNIAPFILSMFIIVLALNKYAVMSDISSLLTSLSGKSKLGPILIYGYSSIIADNLINNIPMSLAFIKILEGSSLHNVYAVIIGSNIGAYLTPIGALAGIMWMNILKKEKVDISFIKFMKYGSIIALLSSLAGFIVLYICL